MIINGNVFYVAQEKKVYISWEKINGLTGYEIYRNGKIIATSEDTDFTRPYEFDNDHHTELFKPATRNWLYFKDDSVHDFQKYQYQIKGIGGTTSDVYESVIIEVYTE